MSLTLEEYGGLAQNAPKQWKPDPFTNPPGVCQRLPFERTVEGMESLLKRLKSGEVAEEDLKRSDIAKAFRENTYGYWLYIGHHPPSPKNEWKRLGQRYWSVEAWRSWKERGDQGLALDHVVPKKVMWQRLQADISNVRIWMERNLCCVVTVAEHRNLPHSRHKRPSDPWLRYEGSEIVLLDNSRWTDAEREPLLRHGLVNHSSFPTSFREES
jgi:hypothetical protein